MPLKKPLPKELSGKIRVLLVDDNGMARNAWKKVFSKSSQIEVVGEVSPRELVKNTAHVPVPEIIVAGFSIVEQELIQSVRLVKVWGVFPKTIVICENREQVKEAYRKYANWAAVSPFSDQDLVTWIRALGDDAKRLCGEYLSKLITIEKGEGRQQDFLRLTQGILQLLFHPDLVNPEKIEVFGFGRLVFRNQAKKENVNYDAGRSILKLDEFWEDVRQSHKSKYVAVDIHNSEIDASAVQILGKYLTDSHGRFGLIIGRGVIKESLFSLTAAIYENEKKVILLIGDAALQDMLEYKAGGINPVCLLQDFYQNLIFRDE